MRDASLIIAEALPDGSGFTWTLASRLGQLIAFAEERFGPRDTTYCVLGTEFSVSGPQVWFPGNRKHIVVQLSLNCLTNAQSALYELAHETVHLLAPREEKVASVLEEGLATLFSIQQMRRHYGQGWWDNRPGNANYYTAASQAQALLEQDSEAVKKLRQQEPRMSYITSEMIMHHCPSTSKELARALTCNFVYTFQE